MACLFAGRLSAAGIKVTMLGSWFEGLNTLKQFGVKVEEANGKETAYPVQATDQPRDCIGSHHALVLVKSWQTHHAAKQLSQCLAPTGIALTLQNGMGNREQLARVLGAKKVVLGITTAGATLLGPGRVRPAGESVVSLSAHPGLGAMASILREGGFMVENAPDPEALLWGKLVINAAINPLTAILDVPNGELLSRSSARNLLQASARESASVAVALGVRLPYPDPVVATETIARKTAGNLSSMLQDVRRGAPTEIDAINGAIVRTGDQVGTTTPINRTFWQLVSAMQQEE